jgi:hypothetical protein
LFFVLLSILFLTWLILVSVYFLDITNCMHNMCSFFSLYKGGNGHFGPQSFQLKMKHGQLLWVVWMLFIGLPYALSGCSLSTPPDEDSSAASTIAVSRIPSTPTPLPATQSPNITPPISPTFTPPATTTMFSSPSPTATTTPVYIPMPPGATLQEQALWLYETNNGCRLPCWWGITPGQTPWQAARKFFNNFDPGIGIWSLYKPLPELSYFAPQIPLPPAIFGLDRTTLNVIVRNGIVEGIFAYVAILEEPTVGYLTPYLLSPFLNNYGQPEEVWLSTYCCPFEHGDLPFTLVLFYPNQGITALYSEDGVRQDDQVQACIQDPVTFLYVHTPNLNLSFEEETGDIPELEGNYLSLGEATGMDVATFYETFKNPDNTTCLQTPANLWR